MIATLILLALYAARRVLAREALVAWLRSKGVEASAEVRALGPSGVAGSVVVGDPRRPDLSVERVDVGYGLTGRGLQVRSIRLSGPILRARLNGGRFSAGSLDPLIEALRQGRQQPNAPTPTITVERGRLLLATDYGPVDASADALVAQGRVQQLAARLAPLRLAGRGFEVRLGEAAFGLRSAGAATELSLDAPIVTLAAGRLSAANGRLVMRATATCFELERRCAPQPIAARAEISGERLAYAGYALRRGLISATLDGQAVGSARDLTLRGRATAALRAGGAQAANGVAGPLRGVLAAEDLAWRRRNGDAVSANVTASANLDSYRRADARLERASIAVRGPVALDRRGVEADLVASALGHGAWNGLGPPAAGDSAEIVAVRRAARGFRFAAPGLALRADAGRFSFAVLQPVRLTPDAGGAVVLAKAGSGWRLSAAGGGLPKIDADIRSFALESGGAVASGRVRAGLSIGPIRDGDFEAAGTLRIAGGETSFTSAGCARLAAARLDFGGNDVTKVSGRLCAAGGPLIRLGRGDWRIAGRAEDFAGNVPFLQARFSNAAGSVQAGSRGGQLDAQARFTAQAADAAAQTRFRPVEVAGAARLGGGLWTSDLSIRGGAGTRIAQVALRHDAVSGQGGMTIETGPLRFAQGGLQPAALSPMAAVIGSSAEGEAQFSGAFAWTPKNATSSGVLEVAGLDFQSPLGRVSGLSGRVVFSSLAPLTAQPGQSLQAAEIATPIGPLARAEARFGLRAEALEVSQAQAAVGGGLVRVERLEVPLSTGRPIRGVLHLDAAQLHDVVEASPFADRVDLDARMSGAIPFTIEGEKVRVSGGALHAVQPGRLSIRRTALTAVEASGGAAAPRAPTAPQVPTDAFSDFAYQAMENLAFTTLAVSIDSRPNGRLGMIFHVIGKHDPPQHQEIRIPVFDLVGRKFLNRKLPLPSGTGVDLTLDTTLNLDDLLSDYAGVQRLHGSASVQP